MGLSVEKRERLQMLAWEMEKILGGCTHPDGQPMTFAELEDECIEAGDWITTTVLQQRTAQRKSPESPPCCPSCDRPGERLHDDEPRLLQTDRGEVSWNEPVYACRPCRRSFFPSLG